MLYFPTLCFVYANGQPLLEFELYALVLGQYPSSSLFDEEDVGFALMLQHKRSHILPYLPNNNMTKIFKCI